MNLLEVFRRKKRLFLVFEFVDRTVLDDLDKAPHGLDEILVKKISYQVLRGLDFCHTHNVSMIQFTIFMEVVPTYVFDGGHHNYGSII